MALQALVVSLSTPGSRSGLFALGGIMMARLLPGLLIGPVAGVLADRYNRKRLMVGTDVARAAIFVGIAFSGNLPTLFTLTFVVECLSLLYMSSKDASLPSIVGREHLEQANQLNLLVGYGTLPLGAVMATAVTIPLRAAGLDPGDATKVAIILDALTFLVAALLVASVRFPPMPRRAPGEEAPGILAELRKGMESIAGMPLVRSLIMGVVGVAFGAGVVVTLGPEYVRTSLGRASTDWFTMMTAVGVGLVGGIMSTGLVTRRVRRERVFPAALAATGGIVMIVATLPSFEIALVAAAFLGAAAGLSFVTGYTLLHHATPDDVRGKTFAAFYTGTRLSLFAALGIAPFLAGAIGQATLIVGRQVISTSGVRITILAGGFVALLSALRAGGGMARATATAVEPDRSVSFPRDAAGPRAGGLFVALEGVEGSGKSTQIKLLARTLEAEGYEVVTTREPGGSPVAERIRSVLLAPDEAMHPRTETLLYAAARAEHVERVIRPALEAGKVVLCDRYVDSSLAYQGFARGLGDSDVGEISRWAMEGVHPDVVVLLQLDPEEGLRRVAERTRRAERAEDGVLRLDTSGRAAAPQGLDRLEAEGAAFHRRVADAYLELARRDRARYVVIDATAESGTVARQVRTGLHPWLPLATGEWELREGDAPATPNVG